jgi:hypothetical protein
MFKNKHIRDESILDYTTTILQVVFGIVLFVGFFEGIIIIGTIAGL